MKNILTITLACSLLLLVAPTMCAPVVAAQGKTIIVTSTEEAGSGNLRQALLDAQSGDTITFDTAVFPPDKPASIFFKTSLEIENSRCALPYLKQDNITIDASNAGVILDGSHISEDNVRCLEIHSDGNVIQGLQIINFCGYGIYVGGSNNLIGGDRGIGAGPIGQGNLIGRNRGGISLFAKASQNTITGNLVGTDITGTDKLGNDIRDIWTEAGAIWVVAEASNNTIGPDNVIAFNNGHGIAITSARAKHNTITQNRIYDNDGKGIHLWDKGNEELSAPTIVDFDLAAGTVTGSACANCAIEIFSDSSNEGRVYEGRTAADGSGFFTFTKGSSLTGPSLTATATDSDDNTSAFSRCASDTHVDKIVTGDEVWQDETITAYKMVTVKSGASLTLRNVILTFESPTDEECGIVAEPGSSLAIYNSTLSRPLYQDLGGFHIEVEDAGFIMEDSILDGLGLEGGPWEREWGYLEQMPAITLNHVQDAIIEGNEIKHIQTRALELYDVSGSVIGSNTITPQTEDGVKSVLMWSSVNNTIIDNCFSGGGIEMWNRSTGNYVARNEISPFHADLGGIWIFKDSSNNIFTGNRIYGPHSCTAFRIFTRNNVITDNTIHDFRYGILIGAGAEGNIIAGNRISHIYDEEAILVYRASGNHVINNDISSSIRGISLSHYACNNVVKANTVSSTRQGILISDSSDNNLVANNKVCKNKVGITVYQSSGNKIYDNNFIGNSQQCYDDGENSWSLENRGNYWSDYSGHGDNAYDIVPAGIDEHPLTESISVTPVQIPEPAPLTFREICTPPGLAIEGEVRYEDTEVLMENSYWIPQGSILILENVTLRSYKEAAAPYTIEVDGGALIISNSTIIAPETGIAPIEIRAKKGSTLVIRDSEFYHVDSGICDLGQSGSGIVVECDGAVIEGNYITGCRTGINLSEGVDLACITNNTFDGCLEPVFGGDLPSTHHLVEGNTVLNPVPVEYLNFRKMFVSSGSRIIRYYWIRDPRIATGILLFWLTELKDPRLIAGLSAIVVGVIFLVRFLVRRHRRRRAEATGVT